MAQSNRGKLLTTFRYPTRVEVRRPKFKRSASLAYIDIAKLARTARAEFEVGHVEAGCCQKTVLAVVRRGMVTALRAEGCAQCKPARLTPELRAMLRAARRRIGRRHDGPFRPMSVAQFIGRAGVIIIDECYEICIYGLCLVCCYFGGDPYWCSIIIHPLPDGRRFQ